MTGKGSSVLGHVTVGVGVPKCVMKEGESLKFCDGGGLYIDVTRRQRFITVTGERFLSDASRRVE